MWTRSVTTLVAPPAALPFPVAERPAVAPPPAPFAAPRPDRPDVARPLTALLDHLPEPPAAVHLGHRQGGDHRGRDAAVRVDPGVRRLTADVHFPTVGPDRPDGDVRRRPAIEVERHRRVLEHLRINVPGPEQAG